MDAEVILDIKDVKLYFQAASAPPVRALNGVSFQVRKGEIFGLVGESGSGKSTLARAVMGLYPLTDGEIFFQRQPVAGKAAQRQHRKEMQRKVQLLFQDSDSALNPRMTVEEIVAEPLRIHRVCKDLAQRKARVEALLLSVGLDREYCHRRPGELSGGQRQRVSIARALALEPALLVADEPLAALDVSIQAQIVNLFQDLQKEKQFSFLFIAHDLSVVRFLSDRVGVLYQGNLVEVAETEELFANPLHPYTQSLLAAMPTPDPLRERDRIVLPFSAAKIPDNAALKEVLPGHCVLQAAQNKL